MKYLSLTTHTYWVCGEKLLTNLLKLSWLTVRKEKPTVQIVIYMGCSRPPWWKPSLKTSQEGVNDSRNPDWGQWGSEPNTLSWPRGLQIIIAWITGTFNNEPSDANVAFCPKHKTRANSEIREKGKKYILTEGGGVKRTNENTIHYLKIVTFLATTNTNSSINPR